MILRYGLFTHHSGAAIYIVLTYLVAVHTQRFEDCNVKEAENCFSELFDSVAMCSNTDLLIRCNHFKLLDDCFRHSSSGICSPALIGKIAATTHRRKLIACARSPVKQYRNAPTRRKIAPSILQNLPPTELQFTSLFGYLQSQCNSQPVENCTTSEYQSMMATCEQEIKHRSGLANSDFDVQRLLKIKLDTSSQLMQFSSTNRGRECLIVRAGLSEIFEIHQKYCFQTVVTRCMCERMNFGSFCDIKCANLDSSDLSLDMRVSWADFEGSLISSTPAQMLRLPVVVSFLSQTVMLLVYKLYI